MKNIKQDNREIKGIDYTKDNVFDAIGRPDLKPLCDNCQKSISVTEDTHTSDGCYICDDCFEKYYCDNCGSYIGEDEKKEGNYYCSYCN